MIWPTILMALLLFGSVWRLQSVPPLWWDEGWTLSIARNWYERGEYVRLLEARPVSAGLGASPTVTFPVYLSFQLFGVGVVQARMVGVAFTFLSLALLYLITRRIYNPEIAVATISVLVCLPAYIELFSPYTGRQVLGEMPALFFLLTGYASILYLSNRSFWCIVCPILAWSIGLSTKLQAVPFWTCAVLVLVVSAIYNRKWMLSLQWGIILGGSLVGSRVVTEISEVFLQTKIDMADPVAGLYRVTALVDSIPSRMFALIVTVLFCIPTLAGFCHGAWKIGSCRTLLNTYVEQVKCSLLCLAVSWFGWFVVFSVGWIRYVFPAVFIGSIFVAAMVYDFTGGYDIDYTITKSLALLRGRGLEKDTVGALLVVILIFSSVPRTAMAVYKAYVLDADNSVQQVADFLNSQTRQGSLIESYDSELFFLLNRSYHYPPDQIHVKLIRRTFLYDDEIKIDYNPLIADPDYLVVGPHSRQWRLYADVLKTAAFRLIRSYSRYQIYERVR